MSNRLTLLDSGPLGMVVHPHRYQEVRQWVAQLKAGGVDIGIPEIVDCELRRELILRDRLFSINRLNELKQESYYLPIDTEVMLEAAELWAYARSIGKPTAGPDDLDADMILAAQARRCTRAGIQTVVATTNVKHLSLFVDAREWREIN